MGRHTDSDICKNVIVIGQNEFWINFYTDFYENYDGDIDDHEILFGKVHLGKDWYFVDQAEQTGKRGDLYGDVFEKRIDGATYKVTLINTHEYSDVGEYWYVGCSDQRDAIELFIQDFQSEIEDTSIQDLDSIQQTL
jgi:hypothetical protein